MTLTLRAYQRDVTNRARLRMRDTTRRGIIQGETGSGKTVVGGELCRLTRAKGKRALVLADRRRLVKQFGATLDGLGVPYGVIMAGSTGATREPVVLASRDTFSAWVEQDRDFDPPDLILVDEAHKSMGGLYQTILARYPNAYVIGLTATPARDDGKSLGDFYGWIECTVPASQLIAEGWLVKPEVYAPLELAKRRKKGDQVKGMAGDPVSHWKAHAEGLPTIAFCSRVAESDELVKRFLEAGIPAKHIDASTSDDPLWDGRSERDRIYDQLARREILILSSVGLLNEGVDIPEVAAAIWWCKCGSVVKWRQGNGRAMRPAPGKTRAVVLDHSGAAGVHGLPGDDVEWSLDAGSTVDSRRQKAIDEDPSKRTVICQACGFAYTGKPACPNCGKAAPRMERKRSMAEAFQATTDAILERFDGEQAKSLLTESRQRAWMRAIHTAIARKAKAGMAANIFRNSCKVAPWHAGVEPLPENREDWKEPAAEVFLPLLQKRAEAAAAANA